MNDAPGIWFFLALGIVLGAGGWELIRQYLEDEFGGDK